MYPYLMLLLELSISAAASAAVLHTLTVPLRQTLEKVCPDEQSAGFWLTYTKVMLVITPLMLVLIVDLFNRYSSPMDSLRMAMLATLGGLLIGMHRIGGKLGRFVVLPKREEELS